MTLAQINDSLSEPVASAHLTALKRRGLVETSEVEVPVTRIQKVNTYILSTDGEDYEG
jgi:DNA-binding transcriptional ArsR family regulator